MKNPIGKIAIAAGTVAGVSLAAGEVIAYLLSHRKADLDFIFHDSTKELNEFETKLKEDRRADREWVQSLEPLEYSIVSDDGHKLYGYLLKAEKPTDKYVFCIHGYRATGIIEYDSIIRFYHELGLNVFYIDQRACGKSEGTYITYGGKEMRDCLVWLDFMLCSFGRDIKIALHGVSLGSATTMLLLGSDLPENVKFATCDCGYASVKGQLMHNFKQYKMPAKLSYLLYRIVCIMQLGYDPEKTSPVNAVERCNIPVIFAHGEADDFVPYGMVYAVYDACASKNKTLISVPGAEHARAFFVNDDLKNAIKKYIGKYM